LKANWTVEEYAAGWSVASWGRAGVWD
jgi:hypothetical protein